MVVSVIIPCYNVEAYVARALDSALAQTYRPLEIIAVDNNSTDGTLAILRQYEQRYPELITVLQEPKQGAPAARNLGLRHAKGEWLQFLDADDLILPGKVAGQVGLVGDSNAVLVMGSSFLTSIKGNFSLSHPASNPWIAIISGNAGITSANLWKLETVKEVGAWDENREMAQEYELMFRIVKASKEHVLVDRAPLTHIFKRPTSISTSNAPLHAHKSITISIQACEHCLKPANRGNFSPEMLRYLEQSFIKCAAMISLYDRRKALKMYKAISFKCGKMEDTIMSRSFTWPYRYLGFTAAINIYAVAMRVRSLIGLDNN